MTSGANGRPIRDERRKVKRMCGIADGYYDTGTRTGARRPSA